MKNALVILNLIGVLALGVLCVAQWRMDRQLNAEIIRLETIRAEQSAQLAEREKTINGHVADLASLREHITRLTGELKETEGNRRNFERLAGQLAAERDQLQESVKKWSEAVDARDEQMRAANLQIQELAARCNDTVLKFNELATNYNAAVALLNERTAAYNDLATRFNALSQK